MQKKELTRLVMELFIFFHVKIKRYINIDKMLRLLFLLDAGWYRHHEKRLFNVIWEYKDNKVKCHDLEDILKQLYNGKIGDTTTYYFELYNVGLHIAHDFLLKNNSFFEKMIEGLEGKNVVEMKNAKPTDREVEEAIEELKELGWMS